MQTDSFGMWLKLRRLKPKIPAECIESHEKRIIEIFGGIDKIVENILKSFGCLNTTSSVQLLNLFDDILEDINDDDDDDTNKGNDEEQFHILNSPDEILSHICTYLNIQQLAVFSKTCYDISRICHSPSSVYTIFTSQYQKLLRYLDTKFTKYIKPYYDEKSLSQTMNEMSKEVDLFRFTKIKRLEIDLNLTAKIKEINDNPIHPITQYFIFKNMIHKLIHHPIVSFSVSHFDVKSSVIYNKDNEKVVDLKDYFPVFPTINKLIIPYSLRDENEWINNNQHFSFFFSRIFMVKHIVYEADEFPVDILSYIFDDRNEFNVNELEINCDLYRNDVHKQLAKYNTNIDIKSIKLKSNPSIQIDNAFYYNIFKLCQESLHSLHLDLCAIQRVIVDTDLSTINFVALKELCLHENTKNSLVIDENKRCKYFAVPNIELLSLFCCINSYDCSTEPCFGSILDVLQTFDVMRLKVLRFNGYFSCNVLAEYGNEAMSLWLDDIKQCLEEIDIDIGRMNIDLEFDEVQLWDYKGYHIAKLCDILDVFDETECCQSIQIKLKCVCTEKYDLWIMQKHYMKFGWNVEIGDSNWRYIDKAKRNGEMHMFYKGPICDRFVKYACCNCS